MKTQQNALKYKCKLFTKQDMPQIERYKHHQKTKREQKVAPPKNKNKRLQTLHPKQIKQKSKLKIFLNSHEDEYTKMKLMK